MPHSDIGKEPRSREEAVISRIRHGSGSGVCQDHAAHPGKIFIDLYAFMHN